MRRAGAQQSWRSCESDWGGFNRVTCYSQNCVLRHLAAHAIEGDRERLLSASGANAYLEKPIYDPNVLIPKIKALVGQ